VHKKGGFDKSNPYKVGVKAFSKFGGGESMVKKFLVPVLLGFVLGFIALSGCDLLDLVTECTGPEITEEFQDTRQVAVGTKIKVFNTNGSIDISKWDKDSVEVFAVKKTRCDSSELDKVEIQVTMDPVNGGMTIKTVYIKKNARVTVNYEIKLPANVTVDSVDNTNGTILLDGVKGDAVVNTSNGQIDIENVDGWVSATTSNGAINITGTTGVLEAETSNGSIKVEIPNMRNEDVNIETTNGSIKAYISSNLNVNIEMRTSNGTISIHDIQIVVTESSSTLLKGTIGTGGPTIFIKTSNGNVDVYKLD